MTAKLTNRKLTLEVGSIKIEASTTRVALRVAFDIQRDDKPYPNGASVSIWNLTKDHREALASKDEIAVRLSAGYEDNAQQIFFGFLRRAKTTREGPDYITTLEAGDGEKELQTATIAKTFAVGTPVSKVLEALASAMGLGAGNVQQFLVTAKLPSGAVLLQPLTIAGPVVEELDSFTRSIGLSFSVQDGAIQLLDRSSPVLPGNAVLLKPSTGLIGQARLDVDRNTNETICVARSLLQPRMVPGSKMRIESDAVNGNFAITKSRHFGDTFTNDWYVDVEASEL